MPPYHPTGSKVKCKSPPPLSADQVTQSSLINVPFRSVHGQGGGHNSLNHGSTRESNYLRTPPPRPPCLLVFPTTDATDLHLIHDRVCHGPRPHLYRPRARADHGGRGRPAHTCRHGIAVKAPHLTDTISHRNPEGGGEDTEWSYEDELVKARHVAPSDPQPPAVKAGGKSRRSRFAVGMVWLNHGTAGRRGQLVGATDGSSCESSVLRACDT
ncbi:hypothetical protein B0H67DRAFT_325725 [Lasiosphaeris hirsuta]|uniref:Uncharacterized protein n=1 Tax=Lasiosphaeris hirsuta TaxID=260670 RepID=A0AA40DP48_9PEZI|nr:hypothetical protein B0H67DRAFT_325725 [Lasiosphaeris hirsuta]